MDISRFEIGYVFLNYFVAQIGGNFTVLLGFISIIYLSSIFRFIGKYALSNSIAILLTFTFSMFYDLLNVGRQCLAVAIFLYGIDYLIDVYKRQQKDGDPITHMPEMDYKALEAAITEKTKAIITVDLGGIPCDYDRVFEIVERKRSLYTPVVSDGTPLGTLNSRVQKGLGLSLIHI